MQIDQEWVNDFFDQNCPEWRSKQLLAENDSYETRLKAVETAFIDYDKRRKIAEEILKRPGMEEALIDELESMGFEVIEAT